MILGLDASTSVIGISIVEQKTKKLHTLQFLNLKKTKDLLLKAFEFKNHISQYKSLGIKAVIIEEPLKVFRPGFSSAQILQKLAMFNGMISIICADMFNVSIVYYHSEHARKLAFPDLIIKRGDDKKEKIRQRVANLYHEIEWMYNRNNKLIKQCYDMSDSLVLSLAYIEDKNLE